MLHSESAAPHLFGNLTLKPETETRNEEPKMAKRHEHLDEHLDATWSYVSGTGPDSLLHLLFHGMYYSGVVVAAILTMTALGLFIWASITFWNSTIYPSNDGRPKK